MAPVAGHPGGEERGSVRQDTVPDTSDTGLVDDDAWVRLRAEGRDRAAGDRDAIADRRDRRADVRDAQAAVRDIAMSAQPDLADTRRLAAQDREASAEDRLASSHDRLLARDDRRASGWDRTVAEQIRAQLVAALNDTDKLPETTLLIGQAQGVLMATSGGDAAEAMIEIGVRADRDQISLQDAARRILADRAPSSLRGMWVPES
jgi:hypothetical protein